MSERSEDASDYSVGTVLTDGAEQAYEEAKADVLNGTVETYKTVDELRRAPDL